MSTLRINRGLPGSGKSTETRRLVVEEGWIRVNRDDIRRHLHDSIWSKENEIEVVHQRDLLIRDALRRGKNVISDDTNLVAGVVRSLARHAEFFGARVEVVDFDVPVDICIARDALRSGTAHVGEEVIRGMVKKYFPKGKFPPNPLENQVQGVTFAPYVPNESLRKAVICDIDGTVADHTGLRSPYDYTKVSLDRPRQAVIDAVRMYRDAGYELIFMSGREASCITDTIKWLDKFVGGAYSLFMRPTGDGRQDRIIKGELFDQHIRNKYNVAAWFDDRDQVVNLVRNELQINCFQVNFGNF